MRIGIDARMLGHSGIGRYTENLIQELLNIDKKNEYTIFVQTNTNEIPNPKMEFRNKLKTIRVSAPIYSFKEQSNFLMALNKEKLDVVHFTHFNRPIFYNKPSVVTIHDLTAIYFPGRKRKFSIEHFAYRLVLKTTLKKALKIIAISQFTKKDLLKNFPFLDEKKITVIYEGVRPEFKTQNSKLQKMNYPQKLSRHKPYLLYVGLWREHKNLLGLIKAFEKVKSQIQNAKQFLELKLIIVGREDPYYPEIQEAKSNSPFKKDIILTGYVPDAELAAFYQNAEAFIFPSFHEGFGLPPLEAMSCGCPVVSSSATSMPEILGDAALYFDPYNVNEMADRITQVLLDKNLRKDLIKKGLNQIKKYSWKKMAEETLKIYNEVGFMIK